MKLFDAFKQHIINHPKTMAYKPTSDKYDGKDLMAIVKQLPDEGLVLSQEEQDKVVDFLEISDYFNSLTKDIYLHIKNDLDDFNLKGEDIIEFFIAYLNREYKVISKKIKDAVLNQPKSTFLFQDMANPKLQLPSGEFVDTRAVMEAATDAINMICNYLRFFLKTEFRNPDADPKLFVANVLRIFKMADVFVTFKHSYDDTLYNGGFIKVDRQKQVFTIDYDNYLELKLLRVGNMMFGERLMQVNIKYKFEGKELASGRYITFYRIKRIRLQSGRVTLEFGQGEPRGHKEMALEMEAAIEAFYEYLDINIVLKKFGCLSLAEGLAVWTALRYICYETSDKIDCDVSMNTKEEMDAIPRLFMKNDLITYIAKLTGISQYKVGIALGAFEADLNKYNDIWTSPLMLKDAYYSIPFFPIIECVSYNVIDTLLERGGYDLDARGKMFEKYIFQRITEEKHRYSVVCSASKYYGTKEDGEEIDLIVALKDLVIVAEAKCIHYSMEPQDYHNAWTRLVDGGEQAKKKAFFVETHPGLFTELGNIQGKRVLPIVITNYPTFTGFAHDGTYVIDSYSFISYINAGYMSMRELSMTGNSIKGMRLFYKNEDEFSANFELFLQKNPVKEIYVRNVEIKDISLLPQIKPWRCFAKSAVYKGNTSFDIRNGPKATLC